MSLTRFVVKGVDNAELSLANTAFPATITISDLEPVDGAFPTFTSAPVVYVLNADTGRQVYVSAVTLGDGTNTTFTLALGSSGGAPGTYTVDIALETEDTPAAAPVGTVTRQAPYYCSKEDVEENLKNLITTWGTNGKGTTPTVENHISRAYSKINAALVIGGYTVPATLSSSILITGALTAADTPVTLSLDSGSSLDTTDFPVPSTVRISGKMAGSVNFLNEFVPIIAIVSNTQLTVNWLKNSYPASSTTMSLCTEGFLFLRECNTFGATASVLRALNVKRGDSDENADFFAEQFDDCLDMLKSGDMNMDGLTISDSGQFIKSYQSENSTALDVIDAPEWRTSEKW